MEEGMKRLNPGRPPINGGTIRKNLTLDAKTIERLRKIDKNLSAAVRKSAEFYCANTVC